MSQLTKVYDDRFTNPEEYNNYNTRYPSMMRMYRTMRQNQATYNPGAESFKVPYGFGQGLLSVTSSLFCTFITRFIFYQLKSEGIVFDFDFLETSDDVLAYIETEMDHKSMIDLLAAKFRDFGLKLSKQKCLESYY